jgi:MFS superfamily sulfate permease-like transporter
LFFANADDFKRRALASLEQGEGDVEWFVLNTEANVHLDSTALDALEALRVEIERRGIVFALARVKQDVRDALVAGDLIARVGEQHVFMTLPWAVQAYATWYEARHGQPLPEIEGMPGAGGQS